MLKLKVAIYLDQYLHAGGGYQQALNNIFLARDAISGSHELEVVTCFRENQAILSLNGIKSSYIHLPVWRKVSLLFRRVVSWYPGLRYFRKVFGANYFEKYFESKEIDLVYFVSPSDNARDLERLNYMFTVWDLCHRDDPEFPEVRNDRQFEMRDSFYIRVLPKAAGVFVDSEIGKENVLHRYGLDSYRVHVLPFSPAINVARSDKTSAPHCMKTKYGLECEYVFYPAQFWAHKNHVYLLEGLKIIEEKYGVVVGAIFAGGTANNAGNFEFVRAKANELGIARRIVFAGFVPNEEVPDLYSQSLALVMPTYFGPTNLPPLEAFSLGVPVLYSDKRGLREQVGDAALLMDLQDPVSMADQLFKLIRDDTTRAILVESGKRVLEQYTDESKVLTIGKAVADFAVRRRCWPSQ